MREPSPSAEPVMKMRAKLVRLLAGPLKNHDRNLARRLALVRAEPWCDRHALGIQALPFLALRLARPHLEGLRAGLRRHLHPGQRIRLEVAVPRGMVRGSPLRCDDNILLPVTVEH